MDKITLSPEVAVDYLGLNDTERDAALYSINKEGEKTPKSQSEIDQFFKSKFKEKADKLKADGKSEGEGMGKRLSLKDVESFIENEFGISDGETWKDKLTKLKTKVKDAKPTELKDEDILNHEAHLQAIKKIKEELINERTAHEQTKKEIKQKEVFSVSDNKALDVLNDPRNKFQLPTDPKLKKEWEQIYLNRLKQNGVIISLNEKGEPVVLDKNGKPKENENYVPISFDAFCLDVAKSTFPTAVSDGRADPPPAAPGQTPSDPTINIPDFKSEEDLHKFMDDNMTNPKVTPEMLDAAREKFEKSKN